MVCVPRANTLGSLFLYARVAHLAFLSTAHKTGHSPDLKEAESRFWKCGWRGAWERKEEGRGGEKRKMKGRRGDEEEKSRREEEIRKEGER